MNFRHILANTSDEVKDSLTVQALKRAEYNRQYQAKLRERARLMTLEKRIDNNLDYAIGYIKRKYASEYTSYIEPIKTVEYSSTFFDNWVLLSASEYKSIDHAFSLSGLDKHMSFEEFSKLFQQNYEKNNSGGYNKV